MRLSSLIIFTVFTFLACASPIDVYNPRSNALQRRVPGNNPDEYEYSNGLLIQNYRLNGEIVMSRVKYHPNDREWMVFNPADRQSRLFHDRFVIKSLPHGVFVQDFYGLGGSILLSQVRFNRGSMAFRPSGYFGPGTSHLNYIFRVVVSDGMYFREFYAPNGDLVLKCAAPPGGDWAIVSVSNTILA